MALGAPNLLTSGTDPAAASSFATSSYAPTGGRVVRVNVMSERSGGPTTPTLSGNGITWTLIDSQLFGTHFRASAFWGTHASPSSGALTIDFAGQTQEGCDWSIYEWAGANTTTPIVQKPKNSGGADTTATVTIASLAAAGNALDVAVGLSDNLAVTPRASWTEIHEIQQATRDHGLETQYRLGTSDNGSATFPSNVFWGIIGMEIAEASAAAVAEGYDGSVVRSRMRRWS